MVNKQISPCATCDHHLFGLPKTCEKCEKCEKRMAYADAVESGRLYNGFDDFDEYKLDPYVKRHFARFVCG